MHKLVKFEEVPVHDGDFVTVTSYIPFDQHFLTNINLCCKIKNQHERKRENA